MAYLTSLAGALESFHELDRLSRRLKMIGTSNGIVFCHSELSMRISHVRDILCRLASALDELFHGLKSFNGLHLNRTVSFSILDEVEKASTTTKALRTQLSVVADHAKSTGFPILLDSMYILLALFTKTMLNCYLSGERRLILDIFKHFEFVSSSLGRWLEQETDLRHLFLPVQTWLRSQEVPAFQFSGPEPTVTGAESTDTIIEAILVNVQGLLTSFPGLTEHHSATEQDHYIREAHHRLRDFTRLLNLDRIIGRLTSALPGLSICPTDILQVKLDRFLPFLDHYTELVEEQLIAHSQWIKSLFKLVYVI
jgi:midasin